MLKKLGVAAFGLAAGATLFAGTASASETGPHVHPGNDDQAGLVNLNNLDALHNVNGTLGVCDNNVNVLGVQVPVRDVANGLDVPVISPGQNSAAGANPYNCASGGILSGGSAQGN